MYVFTAARSLEADGLRFPINVEGAEEHAPSPAGAGRAGQQQRGPDTGVFPMVSVWASPPSDRGQWDDEVFGISFLLVPLVKDTWAA